MLKQQGKYSFKTNLLQGKKILISYFGIVENPLQLLLITGDEIQSLPPSLHTFRPTSTDEGYYLSSSVAGMSDKHAIITYDWIAVPGVVPIIKRTAILIDINNTELFSYYPQYIEEPGVPTGGYGCEVKRLEDNKAIVIYGDFIEELGRRDIFARVLSIESGALVVNGEQLLTTEFTYGRLSQALIVLDPETVIVYFRRRDPSDALMKIWVQLLKITDDTIISESPIIVDSDSIFAYNGELGAKISSTKAFICYEKQREDTIVRRYAHILTVSGTTVTVGTQTEIGLPNETISNFNQKTKLANLPGNESILGLTYTAYNTSSNQNEIRVQSIKINGGIIEPKPSKFIAKYDPFAGFHNYAIIDLSSTTFFGFYYFKESDYDSPYRPFFSILKIVGDEIIPSPTVPALLGLDFTSQGIGSIPLP